MKRAYKLLGTAKIFFFSLFFFLPQLANASPLCQYLDIDDDGYYMYFNHISNGEIYSKKWVNENCKTVVNFKGIEAFPCGCLEIEIGKKCQYAQNVAQTLTEEHVRRIDQVSFAPSIPGNEIHPGAVDFPDDKIDQDCNFMENNYVKSERAPDVYNYQALIKDILSSLIATISTIGIIWGGIMYATSFGDEEKHRKSKKIIFGSFIGFAIAISANILISMIINMLP